MGGGGTADTLCFSIENILLYYLVFVCFWTLVVLIGGVGGPPTLLPEDFGTAPLEARSVFFGAVGVTFLVEAELGAGLGAASAWRECGGGWSGDSHTNTPRATQSAAQLVSADQVGPPLRET